MPDDSYEFLGPPGGGVPPPVPPPVPSDAPPAPNPPAEGKSKSDPVGEAPEAEAKSGAGNAPDEKPKSSTDEKKKKKVNSEEPLLKKKNKKSTPSAKKFPPGKVQKLRCVMIMMGFVVFISLVATVFVLIDGLL